MVQLSSGIVNISPVKYNYTDYYTICDFVHTTYSVNVDMLDCIGIAKNQTFQIALQLNSAKSKEM